MPPVSKAPKPLLGLLGGTFDPIHYGHLRGAYEAMTAASLSKVLFVPSAHPALKSTVTPFEHRARMVEIALQGSSFFECDRREGLRSGPSYTLDTLKTFEKTHSNFTKVFIIGSDAFLELEQWHEWEALSEHTHFMVLTRPSHTLELRGKLASFFKERIVTSAAALQAQPQGCLYIHSMPGLEISSTLLRDQIKQGIAPHFLVPEAVLNYIRDSDLYRT